MNKLTTFTSAALVAALMAVPAYAQVGSPSASDSAPSVSGQTPEVTRADSESTAVIRMQSLPEERARGFFTDDTMAELQGDPENRTYFGTLTPEEQLALREECETMGADATGWMADLCERVGTY